MKYNFNETNIITGYIKELLKDFNLPSCTVYRDNKKVYKDKLYIKNTNIVKFSEENGTLKENIISPYKYNSDITNFTKNLVINSSTYDIQTHNYLGNYLRFIRDFNKLDLMPLYNCFNTEAPSSLNYSVKITIKEPEKPEETIEFEINTDDKYNNYYIVPIKFDETYTIAIDANAGIDLASIIYTGSASSADDVLNISKELTKLTYKKYTGTSFSNPVIYSLKDLDAGELIKVYKDSDVKAPYFLFENNLKLLLKIPKSVKSSIVILEGDYRNNTSLIGTMSTTFINNGYCMPAPTQLSLLSINDGISYPFADRLVEYLLGNVIGSEYVKNNVSRLQDLVYDSSHLFKGMRDLWSDDLRCDLYNRSLSDISNTFFKNYYKKNRTGTWTDFNFNKQRFTDKNKDLLAYGDKDIESFLESKNG